MQTFKTNEKTILAFLSQQHKEGRNPRDSLYFHKNTLYSYGEHYILAIMTYARISINTTRYSNTTSQHASLIKKLATKEKYEVVERVF